MKVVYFDKNNVPIDGEILYETSIGDRRYAVCGIFTSEEKYQIVVCRIVKENDTLKPVKLDESDDIEAIKNQFNGLLEEVKIWNQ